MGLFGRKDKELSELRTELKTPYRAKKDSIGVVKARLEELKADTYQDFVPPDYGLRLWWVLGYEGEKEHIDGPHYTASDADRKLSDYTDGEIFELRDIDTKSKAKEEIKRILKERKEQALMQERMLTTPPPGVRIVTSPEPRQTQHKFSKNGQRPEGGN